MFYKEWRLVRQKLLLMIILYGMAGLITFLFWSPDYSRSPSPLFTTWLVVAFFVTCGVAILGGIDAIAEENDKGTIGFLLTRPISRAKIYISKLALNGAAVAAVLVPSSVVMFFVDQVPRQHAVYNYVNNGCYGNYNIVGSAAVPTTALGQSLTGTTVLLVVGAVFLCLSATFSVYARSTMQALLMTIMTIAVVVAGVFIVNAFYYSFTPYIGDISHPRLLFFLVPLALGFFLVGLNEFKRKEF